MIKNTKQKLQIVIITYNRKEYLKRTLDQLLSDMSPVKDFDIRIINNASTDGTTEMLDGYTSLYKNITHIKNDINIGGNPNICKAFCEKLDKDYIWLLGDNDSYNWTHWNEVEYAIENNYDQILTMQCDNNSSGAFYASSLISGAIYKTKVINETVVENMYSNVPYLFPHLAIAAAIINNKGSIYYIKNSIVKFEMNPEEDNTFVRGIDTKNLVVTRKNIFWESGYFASMELILDKNLRHEIIERTRHIHKSLFDLFKAAAVKNKTSCNNYFYNYYLIFKVLNFSQKLKFLWAILLVNLSNKDYSFYTIKEKEEWKKYLKAINEQKYIDKLAKKLKNKKIVLYGAGLFYDILSENYDLSKLNIVGISDKKFEEADQDTYNDIPVIKPSELKEKNFDVILFTLKLYKQMEERLKQQGINKKMYPLIAHSNRYEIKN